MEKIAELILSYSNKHFLLIDDAQEHTQMTVEIGVKKYNILHRDGKSFEITDTSLRLKTKKEIFKD